jgi:DNA-binding transcriptional MerR regulator
MGLGSDNILQGDDKAETASQADMGLKGIKEVARQLGVTHRTLRFYEDKGLIEPQRVGNTRIYSRREVARMQLILRGKRLGFTIREIKEFLDLYDVDPTHAEQNQMLLRRVRERLHLLNKQRAALEKTVLEQEALGNLAQAGVADEAVAAPVAKAPARRSGRSADIAAGTPG